MPPHGNGMAGFSHSHNPEYPDDEWNLYAMLDTDATTALNVIVPSDAVGVFKPHALRLTSDPKIISDADAEIIVVARFTSPVHLRKIIIMGGGHPDSHPSKLKCFVNKEDIDFSNINSFRPVQEFDLPVNVDGSQELITLIHPFNNITTLTLYFPSNHGDQDSTIIQYIGLQGEHTHYRREAVHTYYEVLCNGSHTITEETQQGQTSQTSHFH